MAKLYTGKNPKSD